MRDDRLPIVRILTALFFIETDYIATVLYPNFLDFKRCWILSFAALRNTLKPVCSAAEHRQTNFLLPGASALQRCSVPEDRCFQTHPTLLGSPSHDRLPQLFHGCGSVLAFV